MRLYEFKQLPAINYFESFEDLNSLVLDGSITNEEDRVKAIELQLYLSEYYAETVNNRLAKHLRIETEIERYIVKIRALEIASLFKLWNNETKQALLKLGVRTYEDLERRHAVFSAKVEQLKEKLPKAGKPTLNDFYKGLEFIEVSRGSAVSEDITFHRYVYLIKHYGTRAKDKGTTK